MSDANTFIGQLRKRLEDQKVFYRWAIIISTVVLIVMLMPRKQIWEISFSEGTYWGSKDIIAPFDFAIEKDLNQITKERTEAKLQVLKTFDHDTLPLIQKQNVWEQLQQQYKNEVKINFQSLGITLSVEEYEAFLKEKNGLIMLDNLRKRVNQQIIIDQNRKDLVHTEIILREKDKYEQIRNLRFVITKDEKKEWIAQQLYSFTNVSKAFKSALTTITDFLTVPNYYFNTNLYERERELASVQVSQVQGKISEGQPVIKRGDYINHEKYMVLKTFTQELKNQTQTLNFFAVVAGQVLIIITVILVLYIYITLFNTEIHQRIAKFLFIFLAYTIGIVVVCVFERYETIQEKTIFTLYALPVCMLPIIMTTFFDSKLSFVFNAVLTSTIGIIVQEQEFLFVQFVVGSITAFGVVNVKSRSQFFKTTIYILLTYLVCHIGFILIKGDALRLGFWVMFLNILLNSLLTLLAFPTIWVIEKLFGFVSDIKLLELSDTNHPLLKMLALKAPGTFQHSMQVANLAEAAADEIKADALLVRVGALYHDIGKLKNPQYFVENQKQGEQPHDHLKPEESANYIIRHVTDGVALLREYRFPREIKDFVYTHHGNTRVEIFYHRYLEQHNNLCEHEDWFRYAGPLPSSKEMVIVMIADSVEAASRSLDNPRKEDIVDLVQRIIKLKLKENQFIESNLTYKELELIKGALVDMLMNIMHVRDKYPELATEDK